MKKVRFTEHRVPVPGQAAPQICSRYWDSAWFLQSWTYMDPAVHTFVSEGPAWQFDRNGRAAEARISLTATLTTGELEYRDFVDERYAEPASLAVKREHCRILGRAYRVFNRTFYEHNLVEAVNRREAYFLCVRATREGFNLEQLEEQVLLQLGASCMSIGELAAKLGQHSVCIRAAAFKLWRKGRVDLPISTSLASDSWQVRRLTDVNG